MAGEHVLPKQEILRRLHKLGYFGDVTWPEASAAAGATDGARLDAAIKAFQEFSGLAVDGTVGPRTANTLTRRRCGLPDYEVRLEGSRCQWPMKQITYLSSINLPGITKIEAAKAFDVAAAQWAAICEIEMVRIQDAQVANILAQSGTGRRNGLDNRGGTLAWSELPCQVDQSSQMKQMYDEAEDWSFSMAVAVLCHELGHALGLPHLPKGNLMAPYFDPSVTLPQKGDINEMVARYGKRTSTPPITPPTVPGGGGPSPPSAIDVSGIITINGLPYVLVPR